MTEVTYQILNISCGHCVNTIEMELNLLEGVEEAEADQDSRKVRIVFGEPATESGIQEMLAEINYPVQHG